MFLLLGAIIVFAIFDTRIAVAAVLMTVFGDLSAAIIGQRFGKHWISKDKAWEGVIAEFVVNLVIGYLILSNVIVILVLALAATLVETFVRRIDDNLTIPVAAGLVGELTRYVIKVL